MILTDFVPLVGLLRFEGFTDLVGLVRLAGLVLLAGLVRLLGLASWIKNDVHFADPCHCIPIHGANRSRFQSEFSRRVYRMRSCNRFALPCQNSMDTGVTR